MADKPSVLCVDDETRILEGLQLTLRQHFTVTVSSAPDAALQLLEKRDDFAVVVTDMRMPGMLGSELLARARQLRPDTTRLLLTGHADLTSAVRAINDGNVFRFLTKPCPSKELLDGVRAGAEQFRLIRAERELLESTLRGAVSALLEALALTAPTVWGRASRAHQVVVDVAQRLALRETWPIEVAAQLADLGFMSLPAETVTRHFEGAALSGPEQDMVARAEALTDKLLSRVPRLEPVRELAIATRQIPEPGWSVERQLLWAAYELHRNDAQGVPLERALGGLRPHLAPDVFAALSETADPSRLARRTVELPLAALRQGMTLLDNVTSRSGAVLITRGNVLTPTVLERIRNVHQLQGVREPVLVRLPEEAARASA